MKKILLILAMIVALALSGCANQENQAYDQAMKKGQAALVSKDYDAAASYFKKALSHKKKDKKATTLLTQTNNFLAAKSMMDHPDQAIKALNPVILQKNGSGVLRKDARELRDKVMAAKKQNAEGTSSNQTSQTSSTTSSESSSTAVASSAEDSSSSSSTSAATSGSSSSAGAASDTVTQKQAEAAVIKAAGYTPDEVYVDTTDNGTYYSMELRENHSNDSAADPETAPSAGFFRYYKASGKVAQLDLLSNTYKEIK
ncbi:hypothetical protein NIE88_15425 [Sporolactobacillus shoreicorticis]|uniref:Lipoprotein n=1 Tax=Sporolactobacillus shoreicorticis TaxID=1923877 RepID=A0ABW5S494_9BACL|nr:hypothetical protein [Sporolactobacillus shoreicorticis]MCO7127160.1 hypothetical protein [Sporolactobacillus shoreicorticis]